MNLLVYPQWRDDPALLAALRECFTYAPNEDRATGYLYSEDDPKWPQPLTDLGPALLDDLDSLLNVRFTIVAFQAYRNGAGCSWHADTPFDTHAILSLGTARTFAARRNADGYEQRMRVNSGDLVFMPSGFQDEWQHSIPEEDVPGERCSLVFRTPK